MKPSWGQENVSPRSPRRRLAPRNAVALSVGVLLLLAGAARAADEPALADAQKLYDSGKYEACITECTKALVKPPLAPPAPPAPLRPAASPDLPSELIT